MNDTRRRRARSTLLGLALGLVAAVAQGAPSAVVVTVELRPTTGARAAAGSGSLLLQSVAGGNPVDLVEGRAEAALPPGSLWILSLDVEGFWAPEGVIEIPAEAVTIPVRVWPTGTVLGRLRYPEEPHERSERLEISLESPRANAKPRAVSAGAPVVGATVDA